MIATLESLKLGQISSKGIPNCTIFTCSAALDHYCQVLPGRQQMEADLEKVFNSIPEEKRVTRTKVLVSNCE